MQLTEMNNLRMEVTRERQECENVQAQCRNMEDAVNHLER